MLDFISQIVGFISTGFQFFVNTLDGLVRALVVLQQSIQFPIAYAGYFPSIIASSIYLTIFIFVIKFIVGR